jgi:phytol kinase
VTGEDLAAIALVLAVLGGSLMGVARAPLAPELARKLVHVAMGTVALAFPWLFSGPVPVFVLAGAALVALLALRAVPALRGRLGGALHGVGRGSLGEVYFPIAVALVFVLARDEPLLYLIPIGVMTLADALAALIGTRYGTTHFTTADGIKSLEGSVAFFVVTFLACHLPLLLLSDIGRVESLLIALVVAWVVTLTEAMAWGGLDNLLVPIASFTLLQGNLPRSPSALLMDLAVLAILSAVVVAWRRRTNLLGDALIAAVLLGYLTWTFGGWRWLVPPLITFLVYLRLWARGSASGGRLHLAGVLGMATAGLLWLFPASWLSRPDWLYPYTVSHAAALASVGVIELDRLRPRPSHRRILLVASLPAWALMLGAWWVMAPPRVGTAALAAAALAVVWLSTAAFGHLWRRLCRAGLTEAHWLAQAGTALAASLLAFVVQLTLAPRHG